MREPVVTPVSAAVHTAVKTSLLTWRASLHSFPSIAPPPETTMRKSDVRKLPSMPAAGPSYPAGPYRFVDREYMVISYETDPDIVRTELPEPLEPIEQPLVHYEWIKMPDSSGFGSYTESGMVLPCRLNGEDVNFSRPDVSR